MLKLSFFICLLFALHHPLYSKETPKSNGNIIQHQILTDSSKIIIRDFNHARLEKYSKDPDFNYVDTAYQSNSLWDKFWRWFWKLIEKLFGGNDHSKSSPSALGKYLLISLVTALLVYLVVKFIGLDNILKRNSKSITLPYTESLENIHEISFDEELEKAMSNKNYRLAVRLLYLRVLKQLNDAGLIDWKIAKTNSTYISELADAEQRQLFSIITHQFEYVWYGDFQVDDKSFQNINTLFYDFKKLLQ